MMGGWTVKYSISCVLSHTSFMWEMELKQQLELKLLDHAQCHKVTRM